MNAIQDAATSGFSLGVLIIGSLYWDSECSKRVEWRKRLCDRDVRNPQKVKVPIRYGRRSPEHDYTYTMVFSPDLDESDFGQALAIRCKSQDIVEEAKSLWAAENKVAERKKDNDREVSALWGCVGLRLHPDSASRLSGQSKRWQEFVRESGTRSRHYRELAKNKAGIDKDGGLTIAWPKLAKGNGSLLPFDVLLAVATKRMNHNPQPGEIAKLWKEADKKHVSYFHKNRGSGIRTWQDDEIARLLGQSS